MIGILTNFLSEIIAGLGALAAVVATWFAATERQKRKQAEGYAKTRKEMDDAMEGLPRDPAAAREWLHERQRKS